MKIEISMLETEARREGWPSPKFRKFLDSKVYSAPAGALPWMVRKSKTTHGEKVVTFTTSTKAVTNGK